MRLRQFTPDPDSRWQHDDVAVDGEGTWLRRTEDSMWLMFGASDPFDDDDVAGPVTLIAHAGETTDLARARRIAMVFADENAALRRAIAETLGYLRYARSGRVRVTEGETVDEVLKDAIGDLEHTLAELDPLREDQ